MDAMKALSIGGVIPRIPNRRTKWRSVFNFTPHHCTSKYVVFIPVEQQFGRISETVSIFWRREKLFLLSGIEHDSNKILQDASSQFTFKWGK